MKPMVKEPFRAAMHQKLSNHETRPRQRDGPRLAPERDHRQVEQEFQENTRAPMPARFMGDRGPREALLHETVDP